MLYNSSLSLIALAYFLKYPVSVAMTRLPVPASGLPHHTNTIELARVRELLPVVCIEVPARCHCFLCAAL